jgi:hypothetical protein
VVQIHPPLPSDYKGLAEEANPFSVFWRGFSINIVTLKNYFGSVNPYDIIFNAMLIFSKTGRRKM